MTEEKHIHVRFYFVSGLHLDVIFSAMQYEQIQHGIKKDWPNTSASSPTWGINFALVTHYEVVGNE